jgi:hypothetical protein
MRPRPFDTKILHEHYVGSLGGDGSPRDLVIGFLPRPRRSQRSG